MSWSLSQLVDLVSSDLPEVSTERVQEYVSRSYLMLINQDCSNQVFYGDDIENPVPILNQVENQSKYILNETSLNPSDDIPNNPYLLIDGVPITVRKVRRVFTEGLGFQGKPYSPIDYPEYLQEWYMNRQFYEIPAQIIPQRGSNPGQISIFGDYSDRDIFVEFYWTPPNPLDNLDAPLLLDTDMWIDAIVDGAVGRYELSAYGKSDRYNQFMKYWMAKFKSNGNVDQTSTFANKFPTRMV